MTAVLTGPDISAGHPLPNLTGQAFIGFRACLGTAFVDPEYATRWSEFKASGSDAVSLDYTFLSGPKRGQPIASQVAFYVAAHRAELSALDWEDDSYTLRGIKYEWGRQSPAAVLQAYHLSVSHGLNPGIYGSVSLFTRQVVHDFLLAGVPFFWIAAYDGIVIPQWLIDACTTKGVLVIHQYQGVGLDRSRVLVGTLDDLRSLAGRTPAPAPEGDPMTNLVPLTCRRVVDLPAGAQLQKTPGGDPYTAPFDHPTTLGLLGATPTHYHVADGDAGVYVARAGLTPRTADLNVGA